MSFSPSTLHYLADVQKRLLRSILFIGFITMLLYFNKEFVLDVLLKPLLAQQEGYKAVTLGVAELFFIYLKVCAWGGVFFGVPYVLWEVWRFLSPGLYKHEKRLVWPLFVAVPFLFYAGGGFSYFVVTPLALDFFIGFHQPGVVVMPSLRDYLGFLFGLSFVMGTAFNLPNILLLLIKIGILKVEQLVAYRRFVIVAVFIVAAILTPPDPISQCSMALVLLILYEVAIWAARWLKL